MGSNSNSESVMDVLARMRGELPFDLDEFTEGESLPLPKTNAANPPVAASEEGASPLPRPKETNRKPASNLVIQEAEKQTEDPADSAEGLNDYLGQLLNRYGNNPDGNASPAASQPAGVTTPSSNLPQRKSLQARVTRELGSASTSETADSTERNDNPDQAVLDGDVEKLDFAPRKRAPEKKACIDAMRELAVLSARKAIQVWDTKQKTFDAKYRLWFTMGSFVAAGVCFYVADGFASLLGALGGCAVATGCMFAVNWQQTIALIKKSANQETTKS
jgi:hypothetical protein